MMPEEHNDGENKDKNKLIDTTIKSFEKDFNSKIKEESKFGVHLLDPERIIQLSQEVMDEKLKESLERQKKEKDKIIKDLTEELSRYKDSESEIQFTKGWDERMNIEEIILWFYTIMHGCPFCSTFESLGYIKEIEAFYKMINLPLSKYKVKIWNIDQRDRYTSEKVDPYYTNRLSKNGMNWYFAKGRGIYKFPAYDLYVQFKRGRTEKKPLFKRMQGIGDKDGETYYFGMLEGLVNFFKSEFQDELLKKSTFQHKKDQHYSDFEIDRKRSI